MIRAFWALRTFIMRAGALTGRGDDLFFLPIHEILDVMAGDHAPLAHVDARRAAYARYAALPATERAVLFAAALLHDIGKPDSTRAELDGTLSSRGHARAGATRAPAAMDS